MSSLTLEKQILNAPQGASLEPNPDILNINTGNFVDLNVTGKFNGQTLSGTLVDTTSIQTVSNKTFVNCTFSNISLGGTTFTQVTRQTIAPGGSGTFTYTVANGNMYMMTLKVTAASLTTTGTGSFQQTYTVRQESASQYLSPPYNQYTVTTSDFGSTGITASIAGTTVTFTFSATGVAEQSYWGGTLEVVNMATV